MPVLVTLVVVAAFVSALPAPRLWAGLRPGPSPVGFSTAIERDPTRQVDGRPRPVQVACWFPATAGTGTAQTFRDYFVTSVSERGPATAEAGRVAIGEEKQFFAGAGVDAALVDRWLAEPVYARAGAMPQRRARTLVLVAQGNGQSAKDQAILSEFLASHGFLVCTTPSQARLGDTMTGEADVLTSAKAQAADMAIAERYARAHYPTRPGPVALVAHSFGARSALLYAARHGASALVSLDGGIGAAEARTWIDAAPVDRASVKTPILHVYEEGDRAITPNLDLIRSLSASDRTLVKVEGFRHIDFTTLGFGAVVIEGLTGKAPAALADKCRAVAALTQLFLDTHAGKVARRSDPTPPWLAVEHIPAGR